jgi:hypothetical protein
MVIPFPPSSNLQCFQPFPKSWSVHSLGQIREHVLIERLSLHMHYSAINPRSFEYFVCNWSQTRLMLKH